MKVIGMDLGGTKVSAGLVADNKIKKVLSERINAQGSQEEVISQITNLIDQLIDEEVKGIGIGAPAIVDVENGIIFEVVNIPSWKKVPLKKILEKKYNIPVFMNNDVNCFALAEKHFGGGKNYQNFVAVSLGTGLGAGIIIDGKLYSGSNCGAGEFGEMFFKEGKLEEFCSGQYFQKKYKISGEELFLKAEQQDSKALEIFEKFGYNLGKALSLIVNSLDPEAIILGGAVSKAYKFFKKDMVNSLKESIYKRTFSRLKIKVSTLDGAPILGAALLCYN